jgi:hypothetical protein
VRAEAPTARVSTLGFQPRVLSGAHLKERLKRDMNITSELIGFPFKDERWKSKFGIGVLIVLIGMVFTPVLYLRHYP